MKIYKFSRWVKPGDLFCVEEVEVEEKQKSYIGQYFRVKKTEINELGRYNDMYSLTADPTIYIQKMIQSKRNTVDYLEKRIAEEKENLKKWIEAEEKL